MLRVAKFDTSNTSPTQQIITRMHQASIGHYSAHVAQHSLVIHYSFNYSALLNKPYRHELLIIREQL